MEWTAPQAHYIGSKRRERSPSPAQSSEAEASPSPGRPAPPPMANGTRSPLRIRRQLGHQHRQRLPGRAAVLARHLARHTAAAEYAPAAHMATKEEQIAVAERVLATQGRARGRSAAGRLSGSTPRNVIERARSRSTIADRRTANCRPRRRSIRSHRRRRPDGARSTRWRPRCRTRPPPAPASARCAAAASARCRIAARRRLPAARRPASAAAPVDAPPSRRPSSTPRSSSPCRRSPPAADAPPSRTRSSQPPTDWDVADAPPADQPQDVGAAQRASCRSSPYCRRSRPPHRPPAPPAPAAVAAPAPDPLAPLNAVDVPGPAFDAANQAMSGRAAALPAPRRSRTWPARTTCRRAPRWIRARCRRRGPNVRYLKELWHAIQTQDITRQGRAALR